MLFQLCVVTGILVAQAVNVGTYQLGDWEWRLSLGLTAVPGVVLFFGGLLLPETPNSLIERGYLQKVGQPSHPLPHLSLHASQPQGTFLPCFATPVWCLHSRFGHTDAPPAPPTYSPPPVGPRQTQDLCVMLEAAQCRCSASTALYGNGREFAEGGGVGDTVGYLRNRATSVPL